MTQSTTWRLIPLISVEGKLQMAIDSWLLNQHQNYGHPPTLRFYTWNPAAISLGVSQKHHFPHHWQNIKHNGRLIDLVKRPSGGRGVLHQGDLTYSLITSHCEGNLDEVYRYLCQFLILGWQKLGIDLHFGRPERQYLKSANCFSLATNADLVDSEGNKFIGSAQLRKGKYVLQHGSMVLNPDAHLYRQVFNCPPPQPNINIDRNLSLEKIIDALTESAKECFNCEFFTQPLSSEELQQIMAN